MLDNRKSNKVKTSVVPNQLHCNWPIYYVNYLIFRYGTCFPFQADEEISSPCDFLYKSGVDYIYASYSSIENFGKYIKTITKTATRLTSVSDECLRSTIRVMCHYYLPSCGNSTHFKPPTSVCSNVCHIQSQMCPYEWTEFMNAFVNDMIGFINCNNTGKLLDPLPHCCSNVGIGKQ